MNYSIRQAKPSEAVRLGALAMSAKAYWGYSAEFMQQCKHELTYSESMIKDDANHFWVATQDDQVIGFSALKTINSEKMELDALFVEPDFMGKGIGRCLLDTTIAHAKNQNVASIVLLSDPNAKPFYTAMGAKYVGEKPSASIKGRTLPVMAFELA